MYEGTNAPHIENTTQLQGSSSTRPLESLLRNLAIMLDPSMQERILSPLSLTKDDSKQLKMLLLVTLLTNNIRV